MLSQAVHDRAQMESRCADPIGQSAAVDIDAGAGKDLALTIQRHVV